MSLISRSWKFATAHKIITMLVAFAILGGGYYAYQTFATTATTTQYVLGTVSKGTVVSSLSESGQVSASDQVNLVAQESGTITWVGITAGQKVAAGQGLVSIDSTTARQNIASAEATLRTDELTYQKNQASAPIDYQTALNNLATAENDLASAYIDAFTTISNSFLDLPTVTTGMDDVLHGLELNRPGGQQWNVDILTNMFQNDDRAALLPFADIAKADYATAIAKYNPSLLDYQALTRTATSSEIDTVLQEGIDTDTVVAQALQSDLNFFGKVNDLAQKNNIKLPTAATTLQTNAANYLSTVNSDLNALLAAKKTLVADKQAILSDQNTITLLKVGNPDGSNPISLQVSAAQLAEEKQNLENLRTDLAKYTVTAPFSGTIASVATHVGDQASGTLGMIVTSDRIVTLSVNEVDAAKVVLGDKATLTFDAIEDLTLTGKVVEIDPVGTVSSGVVSYDVKIDFTTQDARVKPGMTVNAKIQTAVAQDVLIAPSSAVKTQNGQSYVQVIETSSGTTASSTGTTVSGVTPVSVPVETGISDDTNIEITSGLTEGQQVIVKTSTTAAKTTTTSSASKGSTVRLGGPGGL